MAFKMARGKAYQSLLALCLCYAVVETISAPMGVPNRADGSVLVGDMLYSAAQWQSLLARNLKSKEVLWPKTNGVVKLPYKIADPKINATLVKLGISAWESKTCLEFPELSAADTTAEYLNLMIEESCWSSVGYTQGEITDISIAGSACNLRGIIHELGHAMGLLHEQSRSDRDDNIIVVTANIRPGAEVNFNKDNTVNFGLPYDYYSIMQYQDTAGSQGPERVMLARDPRFQTVMGAMGTGSEITFMNMKLVNTMYGCIDDWLAKCKLSSEPCMNGGYTKKNCKCACPLGTLTAMAVKLPS
ncbi:hatching enzyme 1.2 [Hyalella azteca]|uniref:Metalloendopeptidase n=1 Tax=Hyalella azteca TaxID=294128 RepID=A0A8B7N5U3_HYAAZ|nr:hatching enzyme 1.2 [Hyalella azteca]